MGGSKAAREAAAALEAASSDASPAPTQLSRTEFVGRRSGRRMGTSSSLLAHRSARTALVIAAEALFHCRPFVHLMMLIRRGPKSWLAWLCALAMDRLGVLLLASQVSSQPDSRAGKLEKAEVSRRSWQVVWALARSPFFNKYFERPAEALSNVWKRIPLLNLFNMVELYLALQPFYFSTSRT